MLQAAMEAELADCGQQQVHLADRDSRLKEVRQREREEWADRR